MSKHKQDEKLSSFVRLAEKLQKERYRLGIVSDLASSGKSQLAKVVANLLQARYIDIPIDLLPQIATPGFSPTLGAYDAGDFKNWVLDKSYQPDVKFIIVDNIEPLLATFGSVNATEFFQIAGLVEPLTPVILVTCLTKQIKDANFPPERVLNLHSLD